MIPSQYHIHGQFECTGPAPESGPAKLSTGHSTMFTPSGGIAPKWGAGVAVAWSTACRHEVLKVYISRDLLPEGLLTYSTLIIKHHERLSYSEGKPHHLEWATSSTERQVRDTILNHKTDEDRSCPCRME